MRTLHHVLLLARILNWLEFKFGDVLMIHQTAKLKSPPNFPAIWYLLYYNEWDHAGRLTPYDKEWPQVF